MKNITIPNLLAATFALSVSLTGCQRQPENENKEELKELSTKIASMSRKLDNLAAGQGAAQPAPPKRPTVGQLYSVAVSEDDAYRGAKVAKVTIVAASEFACPYCAQLAAVTDELLTKYEGQELKIVSKHFVVHPDIATRPALATCAANRQGKFAEYEEALWKASWPGEGSPRLVREGLGDASLDAIAGKLGLDMERFHSDMKESCPKTIARNRKELATLGVQGTPALYINGIYYGGPRTVEALQAAVDQELKKADLALAKGAALGDYYRGLVAKGKVSI